MLTTTGRPKRWVPVVALLAAAVAFAMFGCGSSSEGSSGVGASKLVVIGIDGMDWSIADPLLAEGRLPNMAALIERGSRADLRSLEPLAKSPVIWTTIATGKGPKKHGITGFLESSDKRTPISSRSWTARPIWDVLSDKGYTSGIVNWMVTWPAYPVNGYLVTDRILFRPEDGHPAMEDVAYPPGLERELAPHLRPIRDITEDELRRFGEGDVWGDTEVSYEVAEAKATLKRTYGKDQMVLE